MMSDPAPAVLHHAPNRAGRDFVVGDLHGCVDALRYLLREAGFDAACDRLFAVGDLIDRGTQSDEALALLGEPWFHAVLGNHEDTLCAVAEGSVPRDYWHGIGGGWAAMLPPGRLDAYARMLRRLPLARTVGSGPERFNILHAEFFGDDAALDAGGFDAAVRQSLLWGRELVLGRRGARDQAGLSLTYCGHTPMPEVRLIGAQMFIDTGAFASGGRLTLVEAGRSQGWAVSTAAAAAALRRTTAHAARPAAAARR